VTVPLTCRLLSSLMVLLTPNVLALFRGGLSGGLDVILNGSGLDVRLVQGVFLAAKAASVWICSLGIVEGGVVGLEVEDGACCTHVKCDSERNVAMFICEMASGMRWLVRGDAMQRVTTRSEVR
jgi:hypothetical protein